MGGGHGGRPQHGAKRRGRDLGSVQETPPAGPRVGCGGQGMEERMGFPHSQGREPRGLWTSSVWSLGSTSVWRGLMLFSVTE